jgi:hypothetical protein
MPDTYTLLEKITVGAAGASSITFTSIPQTYTDLVIKCSVRSDRASSINSYMRLYPNGSSSSITLRALVGSGSAASSQTESAASAYVGEINASTSTSSTFSSVDIYLPNYAGSTNKSYSVDSVMENNATTAYAALVADLWSNTTAISSIQLVDALGNFVQYSTFYLYGVAKLGVTPTSAPKATGGDRIVTDGTYWYHAFLASGTFTPSTSLSCDVLVVAGGGSGGWPYSGGGGAGGVIAFASQAVSTARTVTIGAGATGAYNTGNGSQGSNSQFGSLTAAVGGGGGVGDSTITTARNGGSGGGGRAYDRGVVGTNQGGTGTSGQGNDGGSGAPNGLTYSGGGGGGGAGAVGGNASTTVAGNGGAGTNSVTNWGALSSVLTATGLGVSGYIAGGGGGGTNGNAANAGNGGSGGGGRGASNDGTRESEAGTANTGSGSGGGAAGGAPASPKNGGSGLIIVRYPV